MKLWGGRFTKSTDKLVDHFHSSISFDKRLYKEDILGSCAHVEMLGNQNIIPQQDAVLIKNTLLEILDDIENNKIEFDTKSEDIHMNIETILIKRIGDIGKKLHTGRSRNDQVVLDCRMYVKKEIETIKHNILNLLKVINNTASQHINTIMSGYTHLQNAQPVTFAHHILAYSEMFKRDFERLTDCYKRVNISPLGSGALATTTYNLDRQLVSDILGFNSITLNSMDSVSDRDFVIEFLSNLSMIMMHLSRFCEEIIIWSNQQFNFIELDDAYSTGSSIMPQKKNPDMAELIRGKTGRVYGDLIGLLTVMKGLPLAYNKDMQEDKESLFDAIDTVNMCLPVFTNMIATMKVCKENMYRSAKLGFTNATDCADWLVKNGIPFRDAHEIIGKLVLYCINNDKSLEDLSLSEYNAINKVFTKDIFNEISLEACVNKRKVPGGPSEEYIKKLIKINEDYINESLNYQL